MRSAGFRFAGRAVAGLAAIWSLAAASPIHAQSAAENAPTPIVVQAIAFSAEGGGKVTLHPHGLGASPAYIHEWCTPGHWLQWTIDVADPGDYQLVLRYGEKFQTAREIKINGEPVKGLESIILSSTGDWQKPRDFTAPAPLPLHAGKNTLRIACLDDHSIWLYQILLIHGGKTIVIDPSRFTAQGGGRVQAIVSDAHGFFTLWDNPGHAFEWTIPHADAGLYHLWVCGATRDVPLRELQVNGEVMPGFQRLHVPCTGDWRNWCCEELPGEIPLNAGRNVLRMTNIEGSLNLTYLRLTSPGKPDILINAIDFTAQEGGKAQIHIPEASFIDNWDRAGQWLEWKLTAAAAGTYTLTLRYTPQLYSTKMESSADLNATPRRFELNGSVVKGLEAYRTPGLGSREWREAQLPMAVRLKAGVNVLKITNLANGPLTLYELRFTPGRPPENP